MLVCKPISPLQHKSSLSAAKGVEQREPSYPVDGNADWYSHYEEQCSDSLKPGNGSAIWPSNPTAGHTTWGNQNWERHMYPNVHRNTIYNS